MSENLLVFREVSKVFHEGNYPIKALDNVSFFMESGEILGVIGESGSGKSTLAKVLTGLYSVSAGAVFYRGEDIVGYTPSQWRNLYRSVQMVFQDPVGSLNPRRKIKSSIEEPLKLLGRDSRDGLEQQVIELLEQVGLKSSYRNKYPHQLSGGECQRAAIARAMAVRPELLICDEVTSALDVSAQAQIMELLLSLQERYNMGILFITHDLPLVSNFSENLVIMQDGKIVERGKTKDVLKHPETSYTRALLDAIL